MTTEITLTDAELGELESVFYAWWDRNGDQDYDELFTAALAAVPRLALASPMVGELQAKYDELLFAVGNKYPGESRHQTALRYIQRAEQRVSEAAAQAKAALTGEEGPDAD